jgi:hypothetical protein
MVVPDGFQARDGDMLVMVVGGSSVKGDVPKPADGGGDG